MENCFDLLRASNVAHSRGVETTGYVADEYGVDEVIILESSFETDDKGGDGSLNSNDTYSGWRWILVRDKDGKWQHKDHGYG